MKRLLMAGAVLLILSLGVGWWIGEQQFDRREKREKVGQVLPGKVQFEVDENTPGYEYYQKMKRGCLVKDCIPALVNPKTESVQETNTWLGDEELVLGIDMPEQQRAYPVKILNWHEIVNDRVRTLDGVNATSESPILVTYAPLTGTAVVYEGVVEGKQLTFGVSGKVYNSNTVMYDKQTESLWQQLTGEAVVGEMAGKKLSSIPVDVVTWGQWKTQHPQTKVLSRDTGHTREYDTGPYGAYETDTAIYYPVEGELPEGVVAKDVVYGVEVGGVAKAYMLGAIQRETADDGVLNDVIDDTRVRISYSLGHVFVENISGRKRVVPLRAYAFSWMGFYPESKIYK